MKNLFPKSKLAYANIAILVFITGAILLVESGPEPWLDSEKVFMGRLHNSLWNLDRAKQEWASEKNKPEDAIPTFDDLAPYLGEWKSKIEGLKALGIEYKITSSETNQSDVATLTRGIRFRSAICPYYRAGTTLCLHTGWKSPPASESPITLRVRLTWLHADFFLTAALVVLAFANGLIFIVRRVVNAAKQPEIKEPPSPAMSPGSTSPPVIRAKDLQVVVLGAFFCMVGLGFLAMIALPGDHLTQGMDNVVGLFLVGASLVLALCGVRFLRRNMRTQRALVLLAFFVSLTPAICITWSCLSARFVRFPCHVFESDTKRVAPGMSKAEVLSMFGTPRGSSSGEHKMRMEYDLQIPWGRSGRQFFVDLIDEKVVKARIVRYGGDVNDDFWESDFMKDLKAGKALPNGSEVQQACLAVCRQEDRDTTGVNVLDMDLCLVNAGLAQATGRVVEQCIVNGATNSVTKPFTIVLAKGPGGWLPTNYTLMGVKGTFQQGSATNGAQPVH